MAPKQRKYNRKSRPIGTRRIKVLFLVSVEGAITEKQYFNMFNDDTSIIQIECINSNHSSTFNSCLDYRGSNRRVALF